MSDADHEGDKNVDRREFLGLATFAMGGVIGLGIGFPAVVYVVGPVLQEFEAQNYIQPGSASKIEIGTPTLLKATIERQTGWIVNQQEVSVYVLTDNGRDLIAMSNVCTHLGCRVRWIADEQQFFTHVTMLPLMKLTTFLTGHRQSGL